jgi:hypothetical protein
MSLGIFCFCFQNAQADRPDRSRAEEDSLQGHEDDHLGQPRAHVHQQNSFAGLVLHLTQIRRILFSKRAPKTSRELTLVIHKTRWWRDNL